MTKKQLETYFNELDDIYDEMQARSLSNNIINPKYESWSWLELCMRAVVVLGILGMEDDNVAFQEKENL